MDAVKKLLSNESQRKKLITLSAASVIIYTAYRNYRKNEAKAKARAATPEVPKTGKRSVAVDRQFWEDLKGLIKIVLPGIKSKEFWLLCLHTAFLVSRTFVSIYVAKLDGEIVKNIVGRRYKPFTWSVCKWLSVALPAVYINSMIRFLESKLSIAFRTRLSDHAYKLYSENQVYYRVSNLDNRLPNVDQCLTDDISKFCGMLAHLHSQLSKPILDVVLMTGQLWFLGVGSGQKEVSDNYIPSIVACFTIWTTAKLLQLCTPPFGKMVSEQAQREGDLRYVHSRVITHAEEIAFLGGHKIEQGILRTSYYALVKHMNYIFKSRILYTMLEGFLMKYFWGAAGLIMIALPIFASKKREDAAGIAISSGEGVSERTEHFVTARKLMVDGAEAIERLMAAWKEVAELAGYSARVAQMLRVFNDVKKGDYKKTLVASPDDKGPKLVPGSGRVIESDHIELREVPIVTPNGDVLMQSLSFTINRGMHLLITGPNGCGKSSLFRMIGGLWPICGGELIKPSNSDIFYIPQRPYLSLGNLREQIIYPDTAEDMKRKGRSDAFLEDIMEWVNLRYVVEREGGWDARSDWTEVLSGGEKQRIGMARLFYHKPQFSFLDECTSAVSIDVEGKMYQHAIDLGITLLTVTHRPSLWRYHTHLLQFDGEGGARFTELNADTRLSLKDEKTKLEQALTDVPQKQHRLRELCSLLGEDSILLSNEEAEVQEEINADN